jgi:hypothetical protein
MVRQFINTSKIMSIIFWNTKEIHVIDHFHDRDIFDRTHFII